MSIATFIPEVWSKTLLSALQKKMVYGDLCNRDYEGEISAAGDTVRINTIGRPTIGDYVPNSTSITPEQVQSDEQVLVIDKSKYFAFLVDDVDARQAAGDVMGKAMAEAAYGLADVVDQYIAGLYTGVASANALGTISITSADLAYQKLVALRTKLNEANVPAEGRWVVLPAWYTALLLDNSKFVANPAFSGSGGNLLNGVVGRAAGFDIRESNNVPLVTGDDWAVMAGTNAAISFAQQINKVEAYRPQSSFSDAVKGLHVYGYKLVRPDGIATMVASVT